MIRTRGSLAQAWVLAYLVAAAVPLAVGIVRPGITGFASAMLPDMVHGTAWKPYVKRALVPLATRAVVAAMPDAVADALRGDFARSTTVARLGWPAASAPEFVVVLVLMYASMIAFLVLLRRLLRRLLVIGERASHAVVLAVAVGMPATFSGRLYIYDFTQLALVTACLLALCDRRWRAYYPLLALACVNKETSIMLIVIHALWIGPRRWFSRADLPHLVASSVLAVAILGVIVWAFRDNPGVAAEHHFARNLERPETALAALRIAVLIGALALAAWSARHLPPLIGRGFLGTLAPLAVLTLLFGYIDELRDFYEALPLGLCAALVAFGRRAGITARAESAAPAPAAAASPA